MLGSGLVLLIVLHVRDFNCRSILDQRLLRWVESKMILFKTHHFSLSRESKDSKYDIQ